MRDNENEVRKMENDVVLSKVEDGIMSIVLNRPEKLNAINSIMRRRLLNLLEEARSEPSIRVVLLSGNGKAFCAGADIEGLLAIASTNSLEERISISDQDPLIQIGMEIIDMDKPVIAMIHGYCLGGGFEISQYCDMIYATEDALFGQPEINIGILPGGGGSQNLPRMIGVKRAKELIFRGNRISSKEAYSMGALNGIYSSKEEMFDSVMKIANEIKSKSPAAISASKKAVNASMNMPLADGLRYERELIRNLYTSSKVKEFMSGFLNKNK